MIHIICALQAEASPIIEKYRLLHCHNAELFKTYQNKDAQISLTVSGIGKLAAAQAVHVTASYFSQQTISGWLNIGVCGHEHHSIGDAFLINKVVEHGTGNNWYPQFCFTPQLPQDCLITVDRPETEYGQGLYDMECAGFYDAASRITTTEFVHAIKIVSDNKNNPATNLDKRTITDLIHKKIQQIDEIIQAISLLTTTYARIYSNTDGLVSQITGYAHYTEYQKNELKQLVTAWASLYPEDISLLEHAKNNTADTMLMHIRSEISAADVKL